MPHRHETRGARGGSTTSGGPKAEVAVQQRRIGDLEQTVARLHARMETAELVGAGELWLVTAA